MMASSDKKVRKDQKRRKRAKHELARLKRRQVRAAAEEPTDEVQFFDPAHADGFGGRMDDAIDTALSPTAKREAKNPAIEQWWDRFLESDGLQRLLMVREKLGDVLDEEWRSAIFPESVYEAEQKSDPGDYVALLETLAAGHREIYDEGLLWFLRSRVNHYLSIGDNDKIENAVNQDAAAMTGAGEAYYGIVSMLRLSGLAGPADTLATAGFRIMDPGKLMPWAVGEMVHFFLDSHVRQCVLDGGDATAIARMESALEKNDANMDADVVSIRAETIHRLSGATKTTWVRNQLIGTDQKSRMNRYLLSHEFARWLSVEQGISLIAANELRDLVLTTLSRDKLTMRSYLDGIPKSALDEHLAGLLGFMALDRFKAPATLIAVGHFVRFLDDAGLVKPGSLARSLNSIHALDSQLRRMLDQEWSSFTYLDPLRNYAGNREPFAES